MTDRDPNKHEDIELTRFMLHYCYTCPEALHCDTETKCRACMEEKRKQGAKEAGRTTIEEQLKEYAL